MSGLNVADFPAPLSAMTTIHSAGTSVLPAASRIRIERAMTDDEKPRQNMAAMSGSVWACRETASTMSRCHGARA